MKQLLPFYVSGFWNRDIGGVFFFPCRSKQHQAGWPRVFIDKVSMELVFFVILQVGYLGVLGPHLEIHFFMDVACVIVWIYGFCHFLFYFIYLILYFLPLSVFPPLWLSAPPWCVSPLPNYPHVLCVYSQCAHGSPCQLICLVSVGLFLCLPVVCFWLFIPDSLCYSWFVLCFAFLLGFLADRIKHLDFMDLVFH